MSSPKQRTRQGWTRWLWSGLSVTIIVTLLLGNSGLVTAAGEALQLLRSAAPPPPEAAMPLTDVAGQPPLVDVKAAEAPTERLRDLGLEQLPAPAQGQLPPGWTKEQVANPPQWTTRIAGPGAQQEYGPRGLQLRETVPGRADLDAPVPPDPFTPPPLAVNPERGTPAAISPQPVPPGKIAPPLPQPTQGPVEGPVVPGDTLQPVKPDTQSTGGPHD